MSMNLQRCSVLAGDIATDKSLTVDILCYMLRMIFFYWQVETDMPMNNWNKLQSM